jgi:Tol biopolymer transport system component
MKRWKGLSVMALAAVLLLVAGMAPAQFEFGVPVHLGGGVNTAANEGSPKISHDGLELYFNSDRRGGYGAVDIWVSRRASVDAPWGAPENLGPQVNSEAIEIAPTISRDGLELYFSDYLVHRDGGRGKADIWVARRANRGAAWGEAVNVGEVVNTEHNDITPELSADGLELYFESDRPGGRGANDLWVARRTSRDAAWGEPQWLGPDLNTQAIEHCPNISGDGLTLFFDRTPVDSKVADLLVATRRDIGAPWGTPTNLGHDHSGHSASSISADGSSFYYMASPPDGSAGNDLWMMPIITRDASARTVGSDE